MKNMQSQAATTRVCAAAVLLSALQLFSACGEKGEQKAAPPPQVTVSHPVARGVIDSLYLTGNAQSVQTVELRARVSGYLKSVNFKDGDIVKAGTLLFVIEPEPYEAKVKLADAALDAAKAELVRAQQELDRQSELFKKNATSQATVETWRANRDSAQASVDSAQAHLDIARINLSYTQVTAPFDGRMDKRQVDPGALVGMGETTLLSTIRQIDPIYAYFNLNERDLVAVRERRIAQGESANPSPPMFLAIEGESAYPHEGRMDYSSSSLDAGTGTLMLRGIFDNPIKNDKPLILPGMFVRLRVPVDVPQAALLVPDSALGADQSGRYALVVGKDDTVEQRTVKTGALQEDGMRVIEQGLTAEDWVVVNGMARARRGFKVTSNKQESKPAAKPAEKSSTEPVKK